MLPVLPPTPVPFGPRNLPAPLPPVSLCAGEKNVLQEAIVGAVAHQPEQTQAQVVGWVLSGVRQEWLSPAWQAHLASPQAFMQHYTPVLPDGAGGWQVRAVGGASAADGLGCGGFRM